MHGGADPGLLYRGLPSCQARAESLQYPGFDRIEFKFWKGEKCRIKNQESKIDKHIRHICLYCVYAAMHVIEKGLEVGGLSVWGGGGGQGINKFMGGYLPWYLRYSSSTSFLTFSTTGCCT